VKASGPQNSDINFKSPGGGIVSVGGFAVVCACLAVTGTVSIFAIWFYRAHVMKAGSVFNSSKNVNLRSLTTQGGGTVQPPPYESYAGEGFAGVEAVPDPCVGTSEEGAYTQGNFNEWRNAGPQPSSQSYPTNFEQPSEFPIYETGPEITTPAGHHRYETPTGAGERPHEAGCVQESYEDEPATVNNTARTPRQGRSGVPKRRPLGVGLVVPRRRPVRVSKTITRRCVVGAGLAPARRIEQGSNSTSTAQQPAMPAPALTVNNDPVLEDFDVPGADRYRTRTGAPGRARPRGFIIEEAQEDEAQGGAAPPPPYDTGVVPRRTNAGGWSFRC
jgi:hypothetical protein